MSEADAARVDLWESEAQAIKDGENHMPVRTAALCAHWTKRASEVGPGDKGLPLFLERTRVFTCNEAAQEARGVAEHDARVAEVEGRWREMASREIAANACDAGHREALEQILFRMKGNLGMGRDSSGELHVVSLIDHQILVASDQPTPFKLEPAFGSEMHIFAISALPVELVVARSSNVVTLESPLLPQHRTTLTGSVNDESTSLAVIHPELGRAAQTVIQSRAVQLRTGEQLGVSVKGGGCVLLAAFRSFG